jgi:hypothetical protein
LERLDEKQRSENLGVDGRIILNWIFGKWDEIVGIGFIWFRTGIVGELVNTVIVFTFRKRQGIS